MHSKNSFIFLLLLAVVIVCFIAAPVFSGNGKSDGYPWDADDTGDEVPGDIPTDDPDTTTSQSFVILLVNNPNPNPSLNNFIDGFSSYFVYFFMTTLFNHQPDDCFIITETERSLSEKAIKQSFSVQ